MDAATVQRGAAAQCGAAEVTQAWRGENGKETKRGSSMPFVFRMTLGAHGINDPDYLSAFHP